MHEPTRIDGGEVKVAAGAVLPQSMLGYELVCGLIELRFHLPDGRAPLARLCLPGDRLSPPTSTTFTAIARIPSRLRKSGAVLPKDFQRFSDDVTAMLALHAPRPAIAKLENLLDIYLRAFSAARGTPCGVLPLSTADFASALGIELRTVSRAVAQLKRRGRLVRVGSGRWQVVAPEPTQAQLAMTGAR